MNDEEASRGAGNLIEEVNRGRGAAVVVEVLVEEAMLGAVLLEAVTVAPRCFRSSFNLALSFHCINTNLITKIAMPMYIPGAHMIYTYILI